MRFLIQRVTQACVQTNEEILGQIKSGLLIFVAIAPNDTVEIMTWCIDKVMQMKLFDGPDGFMSKSVAEVNGRVLLVSQFTLYADLRKGRRPSFSKAMAPNEAKLLYSQLVDLWNKKCPGQIESGRFGADMQVSLTNDGPVTLILDKD